MESPTRLVIHTQTYLQFLTLLVNQAEIRDMSKKPTVELYIVTQLFTSKTSNIIKYLLMNNRRSHVRLWGTTCWTASRLKDLISRF